MARAPWAWALAGVLAGALPAVLVYAPAQWLATTLAQASGEHLQLLEPRGTIWAGSAQLVLTGGKSSQNRAALPGRVQWQLRPHMEGLRADISATCCTTAPLQLQLQARWGGARITVADGSSQWPAHVLAGLGTPWNTLQLDGPLVLETKGLQADWTEGRLQLSGQTQLDALAMSSRLSTLRPMGSYRLTLHGGAAPTLTLDTLQGDLQLSGSGQWVGQRLRFSGEASATPERESALSNLLNIIGRRSGARSIITLG
ncbi:MAG: type II secretion system protein N [Burkholderiaceae bacterium]|nr:type II secretion system protein N [Burkholderiaceae bacterium]